MGIFGTEANPTAAGLVGAYCTRPAGADVWLAPAAAPTRWCPDAPLQHTSNPEIGYQVVLPECDAAGFALLTAG